MTKKDKPPKQIKQNDYTNSWISIFSIMMFFIAFFSAFFVAGNEIGGTFMKAVVVLIVTNIIARTLVTIWHFMVPKQQWLLIAHGPPEVDSRSVRIIKERERLLAEEAALITTSSSGIFENGE
jgi:hypothetical protein